MSIEVSIKGIMTLRCANIWYGTHDPSNALVLLWATVLQDSCWGCLVWVYNQTHHKHMTHYFVTAKQLC